MALSFPGDNNTIVSMHEHIISTVIFLHDNCRGSIPSSISGQPRFQKMDHITSLDLDDSSNAFYVSLLIVAGIGRELQLWPILSSLKWKSRQIPG